MSEEIISLVKPYAVGRSPDSLVVVIPKEVRDRLGIKLGVRLHVKIDGRGRIIYEPINSEILQRPNPSHSKIEKRLMTNGTT